MSSEQVETTLVTGGRKKPEPGCTPWLLISCIILTSTTAFVFGWGLAAPNMYHKYTERFLKNEDPCLSTVIQGATQSNETMPVTPAVASDDQISQATTDSDSKSEIKENIEDAVSVEKSKKHHQKPKASFDFFNEVIKGIPQTIFLIGAFTGALTGPMWVDSFDRKRTVLFNYIFCFISSLCVLLAYYFNTVLLFYISRLALGYQGGMACAVVPPFISEIASKNVRGAAGTAFQLSLTIGILVAQIIGLPFIAGTCERWGWGLAIVFLLPLAGVFALFLVPNSPTQMIVKYSNDEQATDDLKKLRGTNDVQEEIELIRQEKNEAAGNRTKIFSVIEVIKTPRYRYPMLITIVLQLAQALSGINAVFFYSSKMFEKAGIPEEYIPYANIGTGIINVLATIVAIFIIEKAGRRLLIIYPMAVMIGVFCALTALVEYNETRNNSTLGFLSVVLILIFVICFAVGLGPIPFLYGSEVCRAEARDAVQSLGLIANYIGNILVSLFFPALNSKLGGYVFLIFAISVLAHLIFLHKKMPETKNKGIDDIEKSWNTRLNDREQAKSVPVTA